MPEYSEIIKKKVNEYFRNKGGRDYRRGWMKLECPWCGKFKFGIRIEDMRANCFYCGPKQSPLKVIQFMEGLETLPEVYKILKTFEGRDFIQFEKAERREIKEVNLPESFKLLVMGKSLLAQAARNYMKGRGFNILSLSSAGIGYCTSGKYAGFIIFPFYQNNELVYFASRKFIEIAEGEKFKNPSVEDFGMGKSMLTYNADALSIYTKVHIVESITNCLTVGNQGVGILGKKASNYQFSLIARSPVEDVVIALDDDAILEAIALARKLLPLKRVKLMILPKGQDVNKIGRKEYRRLERLTEFTNYSKLFKLKSKYEGAFATYN